MRVPRLVVPAPVRALLWIAGYLLLAGAPLVALLVNPGLPGNGLVWDFAVALGFGALALMATMFVLTARFRRLTAPFGIDAIYFFHRQIAYVIALMVLLHPLLLLAEEPLLVEYLKPSAPPYMLAGVVSFAALAALVASSVARRALHLHYDLWRRVHVACAVLAVGAAAAHILGVNYHASTAGTRWLWYGLPLACGLLFAYVRIVKPALALRRPYRITRVVPERGRARTLRVQPDGHPGLRFSAGQFAWLSWRSSPFAMREHPFSISSSAEHTDAIEFTIKELGDFTTALSAARTGERVYVDGPYGSFCTDRVPAPGYVFVAGGIGIAPMLSLLRTLADRGDRRPLHLVYAYKDLDSLTGGEEIDRLRARLNLGVTLVLSQPPDGWEGERGWLSRAIFERALPPERRPFHYFLCGPGPMLALAERELRALGVPLGHIHIEIFDLV